MFIPITPPRPFFWTYTNIHFSINTLRCPFIYSTVDSHSHWDTLTTINYFSYISIHLPFHRFTYWFICMSVNVLRILTFSLPSVHTDSYYWAYSLIHSTTPPSRTHHSFFLHSCTSLPIYSALNSYIYPEILSFTHQSHNLQSNHMSYLPCDHVFIHAYILHHPVWSESILETLLSASLMVQMCKNPNQNFLKWCFRGNVISFWCL